MKVVFTVGMRKGEQIDQRNFFISLSAFIGISYYLMGNSLSRSDKYFASALHMVLGISYKGESRRQMSNRETWKKDFKAYVESLSLSRDDYKGIMEYIDEFPDDHNADSDKMADGDCISRQAAIDKINERQRKLIYCFGFENDMVKIMDIAKSIITAIPPIQPEPEYTMEEFMYDQDLGSPEDGSL